MKPARGSHARVLAAAAVIAAAHPVAVILLLGGYGRPAACADAWSLSLASAGHVADALAVTLWPPAWAFRAVTGSPVLPVLPATLALVCATWAFHVAQTLRPLRAAWWAAMALSAGAWVAATTAPVALHRATFALAVLATATSLGAAAMLAAARFDPARGQGRTGRAAGVGVALLALTVAASALLVPRWSSPESVVASAAASFPRSARVQLAVAADAVARGDDDAAMAALREALSMAPQDAEVRRQAGLAFHARGAWAEAARHLAKAVDADPSAPAGLVVAAAEAAARAGHAPQAQRLLERGVAARPDDAALAVALSQFLREHGDTARALATLERTVREHPGDAVAWTELAQLHAAGGRPHQAVECWRRVAALEPSSAAGGAGLGRALRDSGDLHGAAAELERVLGLPASKPGALLDVQLDLARVLARLGRYNGAATRYAELQRHGASTSRVAREHGVALAAAGRDAEAVAAFREATRLDPRNADAAVELAWLLSTRPDGTAPAPEGGEDREALRWATVAADARPRDPATLDVLAAAQAATGDFAGAVATADRALELGAGLADESWAASVRERRDAYRAGRRWHRARPPGPPPGSPPPAAAPDPQAS